MKTKANTIQGWLTILCTMALVQHTANLQTTLYSFQSEPAQHRSQQRNTEYGIRTMKTAKPRYWDKAVQELAARDSTMAKLIDAYKDASLLSRGDPFTTLVRSIVGQQISVKAADSVWSRLLARTADPAARTQLMTPTTVQACSNETLRNCGLSARKADYIADLAGHFINGTIHPKRWSRMDDADIITELTAVRGIGTWTAEMFLIFNLLRPDVFPLDDIGLQKAAAKHYMHGERPERRALAHLGETWRPWRSVATWYLWRSLDSVAVAY